MNVTVEKIEDEFDWKNHRTLNSNVGSSVELNCRSGIVRAALGEVYNDDDFHFGFLRCFGFSDSLEANDINALLDKIKPLCQRVLDGYSEIQGPYRKTMSDRIMGVPARPGTFTYGNFNDDARLGLGEIQALCDETDRCDDDDEDEDDDY